MIEPKVNLSIVLQGRVMLSEQECSKNPKESYDEFTVRTEVKNHPKAKPTVDYFHIKTRKNRTARQVIKLSEEAYKSMSAKSKKREADAVNCPYWAKPANWYLLSSKQRLEAHLQRICEGLGGISYTYEILGE